MGGIKFGAHKDDSKNFHIQASNMLKEGKDPKDYLIEACSPLCKHWQDKLKRCELKLQNLEHADPEKSCMYPLRDWVTCIDACTTPIIISNLEGHEKGWFS